MAVHDDVIIILTLLQLYWKCSALTIDKEAEYGTTTGTIKDRSGASNDRTVLLHDGEIITFNLTIPKGFCSMQVKNVVYSNDGDYDVVSILVDEAIYAVFQTRSQTNWGHLWNVFVSTGPISNTVAVSTGSHVMKIKADHTDYHGVEIDKITLELVACDDTTTTLTPVEIFGIFVGIVSIIGTVATVIGVFIACRRCHREEDT